MDTAHWPQEIVVKSMEEIVVVPATGSNNNNSTTTCSSVSKAASLERRVRPQKEQALNCPRCNSTNTKFCYYNNYSLSQPRYFCKTCRRYWTEGGSLRNIPVGGGSRKNKKSSSSSSSTTTTSTITSSKKLIQLPHDHHHQLVHLPPPISSFQNSKNCEGQGQDLNLGFPSAHIHDFKTISDLIQVPNYDDNNNNNSSSKMNPNSSSHHHHLSALELLTGFSTGTGTTSRGLSSFMPMAVSDPNGIYSSGFSHMHEFKPSLNFSLDGNFGSSGDGGGYGMQETSGSGRVLFPFEDLKQVSSSSDIEQNRGGDHQAGDSTGYWNGVLGGGSW